MSRDHGGEVLWWIAIAIAVVIIAVVAASLIYGDWTCAFAHCVKVKEVR